MPCERKSVEPLAAVTAPARVAAQHQSLLHFIGSGGWSDERVLAKVREMVLPRDRAARRDRGLDHRRHELAQAGTAFGRGGAAVLRPVGQSGQLPGRGVAVAGQSACEPAGRLPAVSAAGAGRATARGGARRAFPRRSSFKTKPEIALDQLRWACAVGLPRGVVLLDAGYGNNSELRAEITDARHEHCAGRASACRPATVLSREGCDRP